MASKELALKLHEQWNGKLETTAKASVKSREDLALASPVPARFYPTICSVICILYSILNSLGISSAYNCTHLQYEIRKNIPHYDLLL